MADVVVGIDFGSSGSGYAYAFTDNKDEIHQGMIYGANVDNKVPTSIILNDYDKTIKFGVECLEHLKIKGGKAGHYFKDIKMNLYEKKKQIKANNSEKVLPLALVIQRVLEKLKELAIAEIKKFRPNCINNIKYVVTVPAIWEEFQKDIMMKACIKAGLVKEEDDKSLFFALEPEAASYYCLNNKSIDQNLMKEGDYYIVCDLGGGTGDIVTHLIGANKNVNEICAPNGGKFGSNEINKLIFDEIIFKIFECKDFNTYFSKFKEINRISEDEEVLYDDWYELERNVMNFKEGTNLQTISENEYYPINFSLFKDIFKDEVDLDTLVEKYNKDVDDELKLKIKSKKKWVIGLPHKIIEHYIKDQVNAICKIINDILEIDKGIKSIILVGGYCANEVLVSEIKNQLSNRIQYFFQPSKPCLSIMEGAVLFGLNPNKITQRKAKYTFGMDANDIWKEELHSGKGEKYYDDENKVYRCRDCFSKFITINQNLELGQEITKNYVFSKSRICEMNFYKTFKPNPIFVNEEGIEEIGQLRYEADEDYPIGERGNTVTMMIGGTFIDVKCKHTKSGKIIKTQLDFN